MKLFHLQILICTLYVIAGCSRSEPTRRGGCLALVPAGIRMWYNAPVRHLACPQS